MLLCLAFSSCRSRYYSLGAVGRPHCGGFFRCRAAALDAAVAQGLAAPRRAGSSPTSGWTGVPRISRCILNYGAPGKSYFFRVFSFLFMGVSSGSRIMLNTDQVLSPLLNE